MQRTMYFWKHRCFSNWTINVGLHCLFRITTSGPWRRSNSPTYGDVPPYWSSSRRLPGCRTPSPGLFRRLSSRRSRRTAEAGASCCCDCAVLTPSPSGRRSSGVSGVVSSSVPPGSSAGGALRGIRQKLAWWHATWPLGGLCALTIGSVLHELVDHYITV